MGNWSAFLQDKWILIVVAIVILYLVMKLVKTFVKWVIVLVVVGLILFYGSNYTDKISMGNLKTTIGNAALGEAKQELTKAIAGDAKDAKYSQNTDGTFTVATPRLKLNGKTDSTDIKVVFMGQTFPISIDSQLQKFIDQAKLNK